MRRKLLVATLIISILAVVSVRISRASGNIPPGIAPGMWHPLSDRVGIAIQAARGLSRDEMMIGTLMVREGDRWRPVSLTGTAGGVPAH